MKRAAILLLFLIAVPALPVHADRGVTRSYIVVLDDGVDPSAHARGAKAQPRFVYRDALNGYAAKLSAEQVRRLRVDPSVQSIDRDVMVRVQRPGPIAAAVVQPAQIVTPAIKRVGGLLSPTAKIDGVDERVDVDIAIIDTGIAKTHPDLNIAGGYNCTSRHRNSWGDGYGHGTHVAGIAAAIDNDIGVVGIAPGARLWSVRVLGSRGYGSFSQVLCGVNWVTRNADTIEVANMSLGGRARSTRDCDAPKKSALNTGTCRSIDAGVTYVVAAGNERRNVNRFAPGGYPDAISVSAIADSDGLPGGLGPMTSCSFRRLDDIVVGFSNYGADVDIAAPGVCVRSTYPKASYRTFSGTSMASPVVAGAAALYKSNNPTATPDQVATALNALKETGHIPRDPDAFDEGMVNVSTL